MAKEISLAEFEYFYDERSQLTVDLAGARMALYLAITVGEATDPSFYGNLDCMVGQTGFPRAEVRDMFPPTLDVHPINEHERTLELVARPNNTVHSKGFWTKQAIFGCFFSSMVERCINTNDPFVLSNGFLVDLGQLDKPNRQAEQVSSSGDNDGSAGAFVPARPKGPPPVITVERQPPRRSGR